MSDEPNIKEAKASVEVGVEMEADFRIIIGRPETDRLIEAGELSAALLVAAVDLEYILEQHLKRYKAENQDELDRIDDSDKDDPDVKSNLGQ